jgi:hypothetical protein
VRTNHAPGTRQSQKGDRNRRGLEGRERNRRGRETGAALCGQVVDDAEVSGELRSIASWYHDELLHAQTAEARENLMRSMVIALGKFV